MRLNLKPRRAEFVGDPGTAMKETSMANERKDQEHNRQKQQGGSKESERQQEQSEDNRGKTFRDDPEKAREAGRKGGKS